MSDANSQLLVDSATRDTPSMTPMPFSRQRYSILLVDDEPTILTLLSTQLGQEFEVVTADSTVKARTIVAERSFDMVLTDLNLRDGSGITLLESFRQTHPRMARLLLTGAARMNDAIDAINRCQVHRLILKPWRIEDLLTSLRAVGRSAQLERSYERLLEEYRTLMLDLENRVADRTRELEQKNQLLEKMALTDALTGVPNRRAVELICRKELLRRTRADEPLALGLIDADHFKDINSEYLLVGGDHVLTWLGQMLQDTIRATDAIGRIGGEEFMVVAPGTDRCGTEVLAERLREKIARNRTTFDGRPIGITISLGFAVVEPSVSASFDEVRAVAAAALAEAKSMGRNRSMIRMVTTS